MKHASFYILLLFLVPFLVTSTEEKVYMIYLGNHNGEKTKEEIEKHHLSYLFSLKESKEEAKSSILYSYKNSINGFAAALTPDEALKISELDEVVSVTLSEPLKLHTTRSWAFLNVRKAEKRNVTTKNELLKKAGYGKGVIVALLDTGIWPESKSFSDEGMGPIPKKWKGICQHGDAWNSSHCNRKIIGARYYLKSYERNNGPLNRTLAYKSPRDNEGHGSHTSSTVGGRIVHAMLNGGFAHGTASGGAPLVHLAIYKTCWPIPNNPWSDACYLEDVFAAIDDAIGDGVDIMSVSQGGNRPWPYENDPLALGSFHAIKHNIVFVSSAGNQGLVEGAVVNIAPWMITVAASSLDRAFPAPLVLGNGMKISTESVTPYKLEEKMYPLVYGGDIEEPGLPMSYNGVCYPGTLIPEKAKGKIVLCMRGDIIKVEGGKVLTPPITKGEEVKRAGGVGFILVNSRTSREELALSAHALPAIEVGLTGTIKIFEYINSTKSPTAYFGSGKNELDVKPAPFMASFSSRGPNKLDPDILKPDITAPGLNILAAGTGEDKYYIESGTSMSCPHVAAVAALLKAIHPTWSSAAIRSAIMTTAVQTNNMKLPITDINGIKADPFQFGSGHINPTSAADPGLIYDTSYRDYLLFLCPYTVKHIDPSFICPPNPHSPKNLNYPSLAISVLNGTVTVPRTVTNVGDGGATYISQVESPPGVYVDVSPKKLVFKRSGEKKRFTITIKAEKTKTKKDLGDDGNTNKYVFGSYSWSDGVHVVRSPMAINLS